MKMTVIKWICLFLVCCYSCQKDLIEYKHKDLKIFVEQGEHWLHDYPLFLGINKKNAPQIAIWIEDTQGHYLTTVYVSHKVGKQAWQGNKGNPRKEALPHWQYARAMKNLDGISGATPNGGLVIKSVTDGISGATPRGSFDVRLHPKELLQQFVVKIELNHSADFNDYYRETAKEENGQPALVYAATVDLTSSATTFEAILMGHSSPDGSSGSIYPDISKLTTALQIVKRITITVLL